MMIAMFYFLYPLRMSFVYFPLVVLYNIYIDDWCLRIAQVFSPSSFFNKPDCIEQLSIYFQYSRVAVNILIFCWRLLFYLVIILFGYYFIRYCLFVIILLFSFYGYQLCCVRQHL